MSDRPPEGLPPSFHQSFCPERSYISSLIKLASQQFEGTTDEISEETGIPTGKSSGKVDPHKKYCQAMGLLEIEPSLGARARLVLTPLGQVIHREDLALQEELSQLILHLMISSAHGGALAWNALFGRSKVALGSSFSIDDATSFLTSLLGKNTALPGPIFTTYREEASLMRSGMLDFGGALVTRKPLRQSLDYFWGYAYCWLQYWETGLGDVQQVPLARYEMICNFQEVSGWTSSQYMGYLSWMADHRLIKVDRQTGDPLILKTAKSGDIASKIFSELV
jgi:hypothetical protein